MKILYATSEAVPFCKTGGLADVAGSLPEALSAEGAEIAVILPLYQRVKERFGDQLTFLCGDYVDLAWRHAYCGLFCLKRNGVTWYFLDNEQYFLRPELYGYLDDGERFGFFSRAVVRMLDHLDFWPDVIHCNDWQTALIPVYLKDDGVREACYRSIRTVMTVHNIEYQGRYGLETLGDLFGLDHGWADDGTIVMDGDVNLLKGALLCCDAINAVSPTYAEELKYAYFAHRMEGVMRRCGYKLSGVLNGIDVKKYDPSADPLLPARYCAEHLDGKAEDKRALRQALGLGDEENVPVIGIVSRLVAHKGLDLICEEFHDIIELPVQVAVLGKGDAKYEEFFRWAQGQYPGRIGVRLDYNEELAMSIYAGADLFLMPSKSEPCGLSQMIAMRYGTVPVVRETGGLKDTVRPYEAWRDAGTGFTFASYNSGDMLYVLRQAVELYRVHPDAFRRLQLRAMAEDFSWGRSARQYLNLYGAITGLPVSRREKLQSPKKEAPVPAARDETGRMEPVRAPDEAAAVSTTQITATGAALEEPPQPSAAKDGRAAAQPPEKAEPEHAAKETPPAAAEPPAKKSAGGSDSAVKPAASTEEKPVLIGESADAPAEPARSFAPPEKEPPVKKKAAPAKRGSSASAKSKPARKPSPPGAGGVKKNTRTASKKSTAGKETK